MVKWELLVRPTLGWKAVTHLVVVLHSGKLKKRDWRKNVLFHIYRLKSQTADWHLSADRQWLTIRQLPLQHHPHYSQVRNLHVNFLAKRLSARDKQALFTPFCSCEGTIFFYCCSRKGFTCHCVGDEGLSFQNQMVHSCSYSSGSVQASVAALAKQLSKKI